MKALPYAILTLLSLLLDVGAQTQASHSAAVENEQDKLSSHAAASLSEPSATGEKDPAAEAGTTHFIGNTLELPLMREQLTITESAEGSAVDVEGLDFIYGKNVQEFATALDDNAMEFSISKRSQQRHPLLEILIGFIIEVVITLVILKITFLVGEFRFCLSQVLPISLTVGFAGAFLHLTLGISLLNPMQIALSFLIMLMLIRFMTEAHEWADALKITLVARLVTTCLFWLAATGMSVFGLYN
jgi:hypothetical protein